jgi:hypothetical protein
LSPLPSATLRSDSSFSSCDTIATVSSICPEGEGGGGSVDEKGFWVLVCSVFTLMLASALIPKLAARYLSDTRGHNGDTPVPFVVFVNVTR